MVKERETYSKEYKLDVVERSNHSPDVPTLAKELGISTHLIYKWRSRYKNKGASGFSGKGIAQLTPEEQRFKDLEKKYKEVVMERDILKKAIGIFT